MIIDELVKRKIITKCVKKIDSIDKTIYVEGEWFNDIDKMSFVIKEYPDIQENKIREKINGCFRQTV